MLKIEYVDVAKLKPYDKNTRKHEDYDVSQIAHSIEQYGFNDPIGIWGKDNIIVEGHGRLLAAKKLGMTEVPCIRLDDLTDEQRREYAIMHNKTAELSAWDFDLLAAEIPELDFSGFDIDWEFGTNKTPDDKYTKISNIPQYEIKGEAPQVEELVETEKASELIARIQTANITDKEKDFLIKAAYRHNAFNYAKIAEYYAKATKEMQELMEQSALVIIDIDNAIANGYAELSEKITRLRDNDEE